MSVVTLKPSAEAGTKLSHQILIEPRNLIGRMLTELEANWKGFRNLDRVYRRMDSYLQDSPTRQQEQDAFVAVKPLSRQQRTRISQGIEKLIQSGVQTPAANVIQTILSSWAPQDLAQLRPLAIADRMKVDESSLMDAFLVAAHQGLLNLRWDILCPTCRVSAQTIDKLSSIAAHTHCEACDVDFNSNAGGSIEMVFQVHPEIREVNDGQYCFGGPEHSPHVVAQLRIESDECLDIPIELGVGDYLIRGPRLGGTQPFRVQESAAPSQADFRLSRLGSSHHIPLFRQGTQTLTLTNDLAHLQVVRIERMIPRDDVVTATMASAIPMFRKLFPNQSFSGENPVETETMAFVATSINNVEDLYSAMGDAAAYSLIHEHHELISTAVMASGGAVVKTMGKEMLASFNRRDQAIQASLRIREQINEMSSHPIVMGIAVHSGPTLVTTQNNQLDYFGSTVRTVSSMPGIAGADTLISEAVYADSNSQQHLSDLTNEIETLDLPSNPRFRVRRLTSQEGSSS